MSQIYGMDYWESIKSAENAIEHLNRALDYLDKARTWSWIDIFGGAFLTTLIKRNRMEAAQFQLTEARKHINKLLANLDDSLRIDYIQIEDSEFVKVADYVFDNIFTDIHVMQKIETARERVIETIRKLEAIKSRLYDLA